MKAVDLLQKISDGQARVGVVGVGYVGSSVAYASAAAGFATCGIDIDAVKINRINAEKHPLLTASDSYETIRSCDVVVFAVQTPLAPDQTPNLEFLKKAVTQVSRHLKRDTLVILESSVPPGTTRQVVLPLLVSTGLTPGRDFFLSFSPERIDPGNRRYAFSDIPKVVSGLDADSLTLAGQFYAKLVKQVVPVSSLEAAEMTKILENTFRLVNISLINELSAFTRKIGVSMWEVVTAAATKPYGFLPHYPGPGAGGDCIPVLPLHLLSSARKKRVKLPVVAAAVKVNASQPKKVAALARKMLNGKRESSHILLVGVTYKADVADIRESAAIRVWNLLKDLGMQVSYHDPLVPQYNGATSTPLTEDVLAANDLTIITTAHSQVDYDLLAKTGRPIIDTRNALAGYEGEHIYRL